MQKWQEAWWQIEPLLSIKGLEALAEALREDDPRLVQGVTVRVDVGENLSSPPQGACALAFCGWQGLQLQTAAEVDKYFDALTDEPTKWGWFVDFFDNRPREEVFDLLLPEVEEAISRR